MSWDQCEILTCHWFSMKSKKSLIKLVSNRFFLFILVQYFKRGVFFGGSIIPATPQCRTAHLKLQSPHPINFGTLHHVLVIFIACFGYAARHFCASSRYQRYCRFSFFSRAKYLSTGVFSVQKSRLITCAHVCIYSDKIR